MFGEIFTNIQLLDNANNCVFTSIRSVKVNLETKLSWKQKYEFGNENNLETRRLTWKQALITWKYGC